MLAPTSLLLSLCLPATPGGLSPPQAWGMCPASKEGPAHRGPGLTPVASLWAGLDWDPWGLWGPRHGLNARKKWMCHSCQQQRLKRLREAMIMASRYWGDRQGMVKGRDCSFLLMQGCGKLDTKAGHWVLRTRPQGPQTGSRQSRGAKNPGVQGTRSWPQVSGSEQGQFQGAKLPPTHLVSPKVHYAGRERAKARALGQ